MGAADCGRTTLIHCMLRAQADLEAEDMLGNKPLMMAARQGHLEAAQYLIGAGADMTGKNLLGRSLVQIAQDIGHSEMAHFLTTRRGLSQPSAHSLEVEDRLQTKNKSKTQVWPKEVPLPFRVGRSRGTMVEFWDRMC